MIAPGPLMTYLRHCQLAISYDDERQLTWPILYSLLPKWLWTDGKTRRACTHSASARRRYICVSVGRAHSAGLCLRVAAVRSQSHLDRSPKPIGPLHGSIIYKVIILKNKRIKHTVLWPIRPIHWSRRSSKQNPPFASICLVSSAISSRCCWPSPLKTLWEEILGRDREEEVALTPKPKYTFFQGSKGRGRKIKGSSFPT